MHRIDTSGSIQGQFSNGNPAVGQLATQIDADWLNAVQENLAKVIEEAGMPLDKGDNMQLHAAILQLITGYGGGSGGEEGGTGGVPPTRQISTTGLASGGGDLGVDRTIHVPKATLAEATEGIRDDVAVTPAGLAAINGVILQSGSTAVYRNGPIIHQVFTGTISRRSETIIALPYTFPNAPLVGFVNVPGAWPGHGIFDGESNIKTMTQTHVSTWADHWLWGPGPTTAAQFLIIGR